MDLDGQSSPKSIPKGRLLILYILVGLTSRFLSFQHDHPSGKVPLHLWLAVMRRPLPLTFEDRTAGLSNTDFDDIYDRMFFHVKRVPGSSTTKIFEMHFPASRHRGNVPSHRGPIIQLDFLPDEHLGTISFFNGPFQNTLQMSQYLKKTSFFGS